MGIQFPDTIISQHTAVLGKTGSGKTNSCKLIVEQVAGDGGRVCILDPIKSDHWGLTLARNGKSPGLPFDVLGGPFDHVPLHPTAGAAIAELVANGSLPLSIIDMADFPPGGLAEFFVHFAPVLLRKMRGTLHLVLEEAHEFAPKERSGIGNENMLIHWAKKLATAGRSKGVRLVVATQRTQSLHNAVLGSCETLIAHRLTSPADQKPVVDWLKSNTDKTTATEVANSLASLKRGECWICSGEAQLFERRTMPLCSTFDNSATPTGDEPHHQVKPAPVDQERLRKIIGEAVTEAEANDPKKLKAKVAELERQLAAPAKVQAPVIDQAAIDRAVGLAIAARDREWQAAVARYQHDVRAEIARLSHVPFAPPGEVVLASNGNYAIAAFSIRETPTAPQRAPSPPPPPASPGTAELSGMERALLTVLAQQPQGLSKTAAVVYAGYKPSGDVSTAWSRFAREGWISRLSDGIRITDAGRAALGSYTPLPLGQELRQHWLGKVSQLEASLLTVLFEAYPHELTKTEAVERAGYRPSGDVSTAWSKFNTLGWIQRTSGGVKASSMWFEE